MADQVKFHNIDNLIYVFFEYFYVKLVYHPSSKASHYLNQSFLNSFFFFCISLTLEKSEFA